MDIAKKNIISILCGVVILLALISLFWPIGGMYETLEARAQERLAVHKKLQDLKSKPRTLPTLSLVTTAEPEPLPQFPGPKVIAEGEKATQAVAEQAKRMAATANSMNEHALLVPGSLPRPTDNQRFAFRDAYRRMVTEVLPVEVLHSTLPPTQEDIDVAAEKLWNEKYADKIVYKVEETPDPARPGQTVQTKVPLNEPQVKQKYTDEAAGLPERIRAERAAQFQMYVDSGAILASDVVMGEGRTPSPEEMWFVQNALWVQQDVCRSIARLNASAKNTLSSPVKHLVSLAVPLDESQYVLPAPAAGAVSTEEGAAPVADPNAPLVKDFTRSPTGRVSNPLFDVVQFTAELNVDARSVPLLLQELGRQKFFVDPAKGEQSAPCTFVTVKRLDMNGVNKAEALEAGYVYGEAPVVRVKLDCEALLMRSWTTKHMPPTIKQRLGVVQPAPADGAATPVAVVR